MQAFRRSSLVGWPLWRRLSQLDKLTFPWAQASVPAPGSGLQARDEAHAIKTQDIPLDLMDKTRIGKGFIWHWRGGMRNQRWHVEGANRCSHDDNSRTHTCLHEKKIGLSTEQFPVSAYVGTSENLKGLKDASVVAAVVTGAPRSKKTPIPIGPP